MEAKEVPLIPGEKMPYPNGCTVICVTAEWMNELPVYIPKQMPKQASLFDLA